MSVNSIPRVGCARKGMNDVAASITPRFADAADPAWLETERGRAQSGSVKWTASPSMPVNGIPRVGVSHSAPL
jgi:hypothetical protein